MCHCMESTLYQFLISVLTGEKGGRRSQTTLTDIFNDKPKNIELIYFILPHYTIDTVDFYNYGDQKMDSSNDNDDVLLCPYNKQHRIPSTRFQRHLVKCEKVTIS